MSLLALPNELLLCISAHLSMKELSYLLLTTQRLSHLLTPSLYQLALKNWRRGTSALYSAATHGNHTTVSLLLKNGANTLGLKKHGRTVFHRLASNNEAKALMIMLEYGVDIDERDENGMTALHMAVRCEGSGSLEALKTLLEWGADTGVHEPISGYTPLHTAVHMESPIAVEMLLRKGAPVDARTLKGETPLHVAAWKTLHKLGNKPFDYMDHPASWNFYERGITRVEAGGITRHEVVVKLLLEYGADVDALDETSRTPLHLAATRGNEETARILIRSGADIDAKDGEGITPLRYAVTIDEFSFNDAKASLLKQAALVKDLGLRVCPKHFCDTRHD
ncbi:uncharacterized protein H6S33_009055 [Morchella sextelata]|uniref:uncharacterized protein n=1 Tax=Morchella sextelata TaxID=1174677 RepID=UPI001D041A06|nr:uncharacterized protein H6S33_009055 [Morchella sextelata]KAH0612675.1 hypothetical protein H6S33_009055 [Morchella sextelata]